MRAVRIVRDGGVPAVVLLEPVRTYHVGREADADLRFETEHVSRLHAVLYFCAEVGAWVFCDLGSLHGSFLVSDPAAPPRQLGEHRPVGLRAGHSIHIADDSRNRLEFLAEPPADALASPRAWVSGPARTLEQGILRASRHRLPVFLLGPSGAGKTYVAQRTHDLSKGKSFVVINCGQLSSDPSQLASELLGHRRGAFTGALEDRTGKLRHADGGTLFLDEVESLAPEAQVFLLDLLEGKGDLIPLGAPPAKAFPRPSFRLISASKQRLEESPLRRDLAQRLAAGDIILLPTLEERREDIPTFIAKFLEELAQESQLDVELTADASEFLLRQPWPGQVRELHATIRTVAVRRWAESEAAGQQRGRIDLGVREFAEYLKDRRAAFGGGQHTEPARTTVPPRTSAPEPPSLARKRPVDFTRDDVEAALRAVQGNKTQAAGALGVSINTLRRKMEEFGLE